MRINKRRKRGRPPGRRRQALAKRKDAKMRRPEDLAKVLGAGLNQTYGYLEQGLIKGAFRLGRRWFIPNGVIERLVAGELVIG
jgi:hypothetical protein